MGKLVKFTLLNGSDILINKDNIVSAQRDGDSTKIFSRYCEFDYIRVVEDLKTVSKKIDGEIRVSFIDIAIFVLFLVFIFLKLIQ
jgi:flagellar biosynthesis regulator FlaF